MISKGASFMRSRFGVLIVAIVVLAAAVVLILVFTPQTDAEARTVALLICTAFVTLVGALHTSLKIDEIDRKVDDVHHNVNGRMSQILDKVPDQPRDTTPPEGKTP